MKSDLCVRLYHIPSRAVMALALIGLLFGCFGRAQENEASTYQGFEGRTVNRVDIAASPVMEVELFRPLLKQKVNEQFSIQKIRESVEILQKTALFTQVQVKVEPELSGIHITFLLQPAFYVGMVSFPGANSFSYTRMLQAVNIPEQTPFVEDLVSNGKAALLNLFRADGYFLASIDPETQRDEKHLTVNLIYHCTLDRRAKIGELKFPGLPERQAKELRGALASIWARAKGASLRKGQRFTQARIVKSQDYLRAHLRNSGHLTPIVRLNEPDYQPGTNRANLTFEVQPGPLVSVRIVGARIWKRTLRRLLPIYDENSIDAELVDEGGRNLVSYFQAKGFFDARVQPQFETTGDSIRVTYTVKKDGRHRVSEIHFEGNDHLSDKQLQAAVAIRKGSRLLFRRGKFSNDLLRKSVASLTNLYRNEGFSKVKIQPQVRDREPQIEVTFQILEGPQDRVNSLLIVNAQGEPIQPHTQQPLQLGPGKPFSQKLLEDDRSQLLASYLDDGYLNAHFDARIARHPDDPQQLDVVYRIDPGPQAKVGEVALLGVQHSRPALIRRITAPNVKEGQPISRGRLLTAESDLYSLGIFDWASVGPQRPIVEGQESEEILIKVHESKRNTMDVGVGFEAVPRAANVPVGAVVLPGLPQVSLGSKFHASQQSFYGPRFSFQYARRNLRGRAETASIGLLYARLDQRATFAYSDPRLRGSSWGSLFSLSVERTTENPIYEARLGQVSWQVERFLDKKRTKIARVRYTFQRTNLSNITIPELVLPEDQHVRLSTFFGEFVRDTRDHPLDAHRGLYQTASFGITPTALGSSSNFTRFLGQSAFYLPLTSWLVWANNFRIGLAAPFSNSRVLLSERFFSGGPDSLRGFPINGAGPQRPVAACNDPNDASTCSLISVPVGGLMLAIVNSEARFPIPIKTGLGGVVFYDGGNVYSNINFRQFTSNYTNSVGFGLRYRTPVGPIRFDFGYNLNAPPGVRPWQYFVTLGQAF
jgi:outer membrane protein insertion porin family